MTELTLDGKTTDSGSGVVGSDTPGICGSIRGIPPFKLDSNLAVFGGIDDDDDDSEEEEEDVKKVNKDYSKFDVLKVWPEGESRPPLAKFVNKDSWLMFFLLDLR